MTAPIVPSSFFYWLEVVSKVRAVLTFLLVASTIIFPIVYLIYIILEREDKKVNPKRHLKYFIWFYIIILIPYILIPSKETLIEMQVAKYVTVQNIKQSKQGILNLIKDLIKITKEDLNKDTKNR